MTITCDTDIGSIISLDDVEPICSSLFQDLDYYVTTINNTIEREESTGGLSTDSYYVDDSPELNLHANTLVSNIQLLSSFESCKEVIEAKVLEQRAKELKELADAIVLKLDALEDEYDALCADNPSLHSARLTQIKNSYADYLAKYHTVKGLM